MRARANGFGLSSGEIEVPWYVYPTFIVNIKVNRSWFGIRIAIPNPCRVAYVRSMRKRQDDFRRRILGEQLWSVRNQTYKQSLHQELARIRASHPGE